MTAKSMDWYARKYITEFGFHLVPIEPGRKFPRSKDWGNNTLSCPDAAAEFYKGNSKWNMGVALGPSRLCSLDIDCYDSFSLICEAFGFDLSELIKATPTIQGKAPGLRLMFRVPGGVDLPYVKLNWPNQKDPSGQKHRDMMARAKQLKEEHEVEHDPERKDKLKKQELDLREEAKHYARYTVFELRAATDGHQRQDVVPCSIHPETGEPYKWVTQPRKDWPEPPRWLISAWVEFDKIKPQFMAICPWAEIEEVKQSKIKDSRPRFNGSSDSNVVDSYNKSVSIDAELSKYGYDRRGNRWLSPHSSTQLPGVVSLPDSNKVWIHHASDPLCSEDSGRPVSPFDLFCYYEFRGDFKRAHQAVAEQLGIRVNAPVRRQNIDLETGEILDFAEPEDPLGFLSASSDDLVGVRGLPDTVDGENSDFVDYYSPLPWTKPKGGPLSHIDNLREIIRRLDVTVRYNTIKKSEEILIPGKFFSIDNRDNAALAWLMSECSIFEFSTDKLQPFITALADENQYNPVANWITSKPWDGVSRLSDLFNTVSVPNPDREPIRDALIKRWMLSAVVAATHPNGVSAHGMLVFQGGQSIGKTSWFRSLVPESLEVVADGLLLRPDDKDSVKQVVSHWLVELGELDATFRKSDIAALKSFITRDRDEVRLPYAKKESKFARRTVFFGSVNPKEYLNDDTGNRRYWTIECDSINYNHGLDMQQVWAEVYELHKQGEQHWLTREEHAELNLINEDYLTIDPVQEVIMEKLDWDAPESLWRWDQVTKIMHECGMDRPSRSDLRIASGVIRKLNGDRSRRYGGARQVFRPPLKHGGYM